MELNVLFVYIGTAGALLLFITYFASIFEKIKKAGKSVEEILSGLPEEILTFIIPLLSWLSTLLYFGTELTVDRVKRALSGGNIVEMIAALTLIISIVMLLMAVAYYIRSVLPALVAVGGFVLGFFVIVFSIYSAVTGNPISIPALIFGILVLLASYVLGRLKLKR